MGAFILRGRYDTDDGSSHWSKRYVGKHDVFYTGFNEGKGIWGTWELESEDFGFNFRGGFHIWPEGMADPTGDKLKEAVDATSFLCDEADTDEPVLVP